MCRPPWHERALWLIACRPPCASPMMAAMATTRRADMFIAAASDDDPRENGPTLGDERTTLVEALRCARLTLEMKCAGLDAEAMARRSVEPSTMSLLGLVRHLAEMERGTFREMMAGQDVPRLFCSDTDRDGDFDGAVRRPPGGRGGVGRVASGGGLRRAVRGRGTQSRHHRRRSLEPAWQRWRAMSLREVLVGMI